MERLICGHSIISTIMPTTHESLQHQQQVSSGRRWFTWLLIVLHHTDEEHLSAQPDDYLFSEWTQMNNLLGCTSRKLVKQYFTIENWWTMAAVTYDLVPYCFMESEFISLLLWRQTSIHVYIIHHVIQFNELYNIAWRQALYPSWRR